MEAFILAHEPALRLAAFVAVFAAMAAWEVAAPRRQRLIPRTSRWPANLAVVALDTIVVRLLLPTAVVGFAVWIQARGWGLFNPLHPAPWLAVVVGLLVLDFAIYAQHRLFHAVPVLWRVHRMHHADLDIDVTTGARFHPFEIVLSLLIKCAIIAVAGIPPVAVFVFEVMLNASSMFNHSNVRIAATADNLLRRLVVTPDMHRVHHSIDPDETHRNFGFNLSIWDRLLGTYREAPRAGHEGIVIGIPDFREPSTCSRLAGMLSIPFRDGVPGGVPVARLPP